MLWCGFGWPSDVCGVSGLEIRDADVDSELEMSLVEMLRNCDAQVGRERGRKETKLVPMKKQSLQDGY